jgi:hypothetical protein
MLKSATQLSLEIAISEMSALFKIVLFSQNAILETKIKSKMMSLSTKNKFENYSQVLYFI